MVARRSLIPKIQVRFLQAPFLLFFDTSLLSQKDIEDHFLKGLNLFTGSFRCLNLGLII